ncbi:MAG: alpha/beta hydrolase [SAR324 cluster bacterium]|nr:alpha/beta hydrolase [SAR324 cluster bacterium]
MLGKPPAFAVNQWIITMAYLERNGASLYYDLLECTPPWMENPGTVLFCHGVGTNADIWSDWLSVLAGSYRILRFDLRGFGRSTVPGAGFDWSFELLMDDVLAVADVACSGGKFHYVGESLGGTLGLALADAHGKRLHSLTACSTAHRGGDIRKVADWRAFIEKEGMDAWSEQMMPLRFHDGAVPAPVHRWFHEIQRGSSADAILDLADLLMRADLTESLPGISVPTLLLAPDASPFVSLDITRDIHTRIPDCELQVFAGARHGLACSHGGDCARAVHGFLLRRGFA